MRSDSGSRARLLAVLSDSASSGFTTKPFDAKPIAGAINSAHFFRPYFDCASSNPRTVPGTPEERHPSTDSS